MSTLGNDHGTTPAAAQSIDFSTLFAANIHEIKNLLFNLLISLDQVIDESAVQNCAIADLHSKLLPLRYNGQRINDRLVQLLSLYRIANDLYQLDIEYYSVREFVEDVVIETRPLLEARGLTLTADVDDALCWFFDREILSGIVLNAIHNALRYAKSEIRVHAKKEGEMLIVSVMDDGPGFPSQVLQPSGVVGKLSCTDGRNGLGLYFSAKTACLHVSPDNTRGTLSLSNGGELGGAVFSVMLP
jgi:signal transduction histidine kinase